MYASSPHVTELHDKIEHFVKALLEMFILQKAIFDYLG
jgi:hypothetical protein